MRAPQKMEVKRGYGEGAPPKWARMQVSLDMYFEGTDSMAQAEQWEARLKELMSPVGDEASE